MYFYITLNLFTTFWFNSKQKIVFQIADTILQNLRHNHKSFVQCNYFVVKISLFISFFNCLSQQLLSLNFAI